MTVLFADLVRRGDAEAARVVRVAPGYLPGGMVSVSRKHDDGSIDSVQHAEIASILEPEQLECLYWDAVRRVTLGAARFSRDAIRVGGRWPVILRFGPLVDGRRQIAGGLFAACAGGTIGWDASGGQTSVSVQGFTPILRGPLWRIEARFHTAVGRRFFARVAREAR